jgi:hypothetical protein
VYLRSPEARARWHNRCTHRAPSVETMGLVGMDGPSGDDGIIEGGGRASCRQRRCGAPCRRPPVVVGRVGCHARIDDGIEGDLDCLHSFRFVSLSSQQSCCVAEQMHARTTGAIWVIQESSLVCRIVGYPTWSAKPSWSSRWVQSYKFSRLNKAVSVQVVTVKHRDYVTDIACYRRQHSVPNHRRVVTLFFFPIEAEGIRVRNNQAL